jgi:hypothetical protein
MIHHLMLLVHATVRRAASKAGRDGKAGRRDDLEARHPFLADNELRRPADERIIGTAAA